MTLNADGGMITFIPHISAADVLPAVNEMGAALQAETLPQTAREFKREARTAMAPDITIWAGIAEMTPDDVLEQIINEARAAQQPIARCAPGEGESS